MTGLNKIIIILSTLRKIANLIVQVEKFEYPNNNHDKKNPYRH